MNAHSTARGVSLLVLTALCALLIVACGGSPKQSAASGRSQSAWSLKQLTTGAYKHSACMRHHGVSDFPDPTITSSGHGQVVAIQITPTIADSPSFKSAQKVCAHLLPASQGNGNSEPSAAQQRARTQGLLAFATCMRRHGFPRFPDPDTQGRLSLAMIQQAGINLHEPAVKPAADTCTAASHGQVTKADVVQAIADPGSTSTTG